jgi:hypothetical protein
VRISCVVLILQILVVQSFAAPAAVRIVSSPKPGLLFLLGTGLVGLATLIRRRLAS